MTDTSIPQVTVSDHGGVPTLYVDGRPHPGLGFWHPTKPHGMEEWRQFARSGVSLFMINLPLWPSDAGPSAPETVWERGFELLEKAHPDFRAWIRLDLEPPETWLRAHPEEAQIHYDEQRGDRFSWRVAFAAPLWRRETAGRLERFIATVEARWGHRVWCYQLHAGDCGEWAYSWKPVLSGYAPAQIAAWREWLRERYGHEERLREAWGDTSAGFENAEPPPWSGRLRPRQWPPASHLHDPASDRRLVDWLTFHGYAQADALARLAGVARRALESLGRKKLIAAFHGYHFAPYGAAYFYGNAGYSDLDLVLRSPDLDALCTPLAYIHRNPGGVTSHHNLATSIRLHGKLFFTEDDTFTHRAQWTPWRYCCRTAEETLEILWRNLAGILAEGGSQWWMDHDGGGWYLDPVLEKGIQQMRKVAEETLARDRAPCAQVVCVTNEASFRLLRQDVALSDLLWPRTQIELMRIGAPVEFVRVRDLAIAESRGETARWRFVVVSGCLWLDDEERALLERTLLGGGRHVLFLHGQGISDGRRLDLNRVSDLTGIRIRLYPLGGPCRAEAVMEGRHLEWGTDREVAPILSVDDPNAEIRGWLERQYEAVLARKAQGDWTSWWCGVPGLPWFLLGRMSEEAGVHRYLDEGSQVMANRSLLAAHALSEGDCKLRLPGRRRVWEAVTGRDLGTVLGFPIRMHRGQTHLWFLE